MNQDKIKIAEETYNKIVERAKSDDRIVGLVLSGSRGKGKETANSDFDIVIVTTDESLKDVENDYKPEGDMDLGCKSLSSFRAHADMGTSEEWDRYGHTHLKAVIDKTGEIQKIIDEKGKIPDANIRKVVEDAFDGYANFVYRSAKNARDGNMRASYMDALESIPYLLTFAFGLDGRIRPYNKYLEWELDNWPLKTFGMPKGELFTYFDTITKNADLDVQKKLFMYTRDVALKNDYQSIVEGWKGNYFVDPEVE